MCVERLKAVIIGVDESDGIKNQENRPKIGKIGRKTQETCGKQAFPIDFAHLEAAL
jgi:hypothetical protein